MESLQSHMILTMSHWSNGLTVLYTEGWVCDVALIEYTLGSGETQEGLGFWKGGYKGPMGDKGS